MRKNVQKACFWVILWFHLLLNGTFLGYKTLNSQLFWGKYLENRNHLDDHFDVFRNHLGEHFALFGLYKCEHFKAFTAKYTLYVICAFRKLQKGTHFIGAVATATSESAQP